MPASCVVGGCSRNAKKNPDVHFLAFPNATKDSATRREWKRFVNNTRSDFKLTSSSLICSSHFDAKCQDESTKLQCQFGLKIKFRLKPGSVPTLKAPFAYSVKATAATDTVPPAGCSAGSSETTLAGGGGNEDNRDHGYVRVPSLKSPFKRRKRSGLAFEKRERARVLLEAEQTYDANLCGDSESTDSAQSSPMENPDGDDYFPAECPQNPDKPICTLQLDVIKHNINPCQPPKVLFVRSKRSQTDPNKFSVTNKGVQTKRAPKKTSSQATQCQVVKLPPLKVLTPLQPLELQKQPLHDYVSDHVEEEEQEEVASSSESEYLLSSGDSTDSDLDFSDTPPGPDDKKFLVFERNLLQLFQYCPKCEGPTKGRLKRPMCGTLIEVEQTCKRRGCGHWRKWRSQPMVGNVSAGNVLLATTMLLSGLSIKKFLRALTSINVSVFSYATFFNYQRRYLQPAIVHVWNSEQASTVAAIKASKKDAFLGMDMRADSMGHSAKYGTYSVMEMNLGKVLHVETVQKSETNHKSNLMEKEGLVRSVEWIDGKGLKIGTIVTDRHKQITKYIREELTTPRGTSHFFDIWHVAKGLKKKLMAAGKSKGCETVKDWVHSIVNNLYWVAASTPGCDPDLMWAKFESIINHLMDIHEHENQLYPKCQHGPLAPRKWLIPGSKPAEKVAALLDNPWIKKDVRMLSSSMQTSSVEAFHSLINQFAPKMFVYSYHGMICRMYLAALHYNENAGREQARSSGGSLAYSISYPRAKQDTGGYTVRKRLVQCTYKYNQRIIDQTIRLFEEGSKDARTRYSQLTKNPGPLTLKHTKPDKATAVSTFISRFSKSVEPVGRPEGTQDMVVKDKATKRKKSKSKDKKGKSAKKQGGKKMNQNRTEDDSGQGSAVKRSSRKRKKSGRGETSQTE